MIPPLIFTRSYRNKTFPLLPNISSPLLENLPSNSRCGVSFREENIPTIPAFSPLDFSRIGATTEEAIIRNNLPPTERSARAPSKKCQPSPSPPLSLVTRCTAQLKRTRVSRRDVSLAARVAPPPISRLYFTVQTVLAREPLCLSGGVLQPDLVAAAAALTSFPLPPARNLEM